MASEKVALVLSWSTTHLRLGERSWSRQSRRIKALPQRNGVRHASVRPLVPNPDVIDDDAGGLVYAFQPLCLVRYVVHRKVLGTGHGFAVPLVHRRVPLFVYPCVLGIRERPLPNPVGHAPGKPPRFDARFAFLSFLHQPALVPAAAPEVVPSVHVASFHPRRRLAVPTCLNLDNVE